MIRSMITCIFLTASLFALGQKKPAEKAPTQKEMQDMLKQSQQMLDAVMKEMTPEERRMIDSLGIPMPDMNKAAKSVAKVSDAQLKTAAENENRIVPKKNIAKIAAMPAPVSTAAMGAYIVSVQSKTLPSLPAEIKKVAEKIYAALSSKSAYEQGAAATALWVTGKTQLAFYVMGRACAADPTQTDNLNNYAAMMSMLGAQQLALPLLQNLNSRFPANSTVLNNIGQAWFGLGDIPKAEKYIDSAIRISADHPQANFTKSLIEESRGNKTAAIAAMKRSMIKAYTPQKEAKLKALGYTPVDKDFTVPGKKESDGFNLSGFAAPSFPMSVSECVSVGQQWKGFRQQINAELARQISRKQQMDKDAMAVTKKRMNDDIAAVRAVMADPDATGTVSSVPMYAERAAKKLQPAKENYDRRMEVFGKKLSGYLTGTEKMLTTNYEQAMDSLREKDLQQTGEGKRNENFCPKYRDVSDAYLKEVNGERQALYKEFLQIEKEYINEAAYWGLYMEYPEAYESLKIGLQAQWLNDLKNESSGMDFISITKYVCIPPQSSKVGTLKKFDDVACKYHSSFWTPVGTIESDCSKMTTKFELGILSVELKQDMDRAEGDQFENSTIILGPKMGKEVKVGPATVTAEGKAGVGVEIGRNGVTDVFIIGGVEAGVSVGDPVGVSAGVEGRISVISGAGSVSGTGMLEGVK